mgnify:FL=1
MIIYSSGKTATTRPRPASPKSLTDAHGVVEGNGISWQHGNAPTTLTGAEKKEICRALGVKQVKEAKALMIKRYMVTKSCAQIVAAFNGRKGWSESYITKVHSALSKHAGEGF